MNYKQLSSHFTEELIEERHFGRLSPSETQLFDLHARLCQACAVKFHNERMFIYAMQAALERPEPLKIAMARPSKLLPTPRRSS